MTDLTVEEVKQLLEKAQLYGEAEKSIPGHYTEINRNDLYKMAQALSIALAHLKAREEGGELVEQLRYGADILRERPSEWYDGSGYCRRAADTITAQAGEIARLREALEWIRDYPPKEGRSCPDGYPLEVAYDEYAYKRIVDSYRDAARTAVQQKPHGQQGKAQ